MTGDRNAIFFAAPRFPAATRKMSLSGPLSGYTSGHTRTITSDGTPSPHRLAVCDRLPSTASVSAGHRNSRCGFAGCRRPSAALCPRRREDDRARPDGEHPGIGGDVDRCRARPPTSRPGPSTSEPAVRPAPLVAPLPNPCAYCHPAPAMPRARSAWTPAPAPSRQRTIVASSSLNMTQTETWAYQKEVTIISQFSRKSDST